MWSIASTRPRAPSTRSRSARSRTASLYGRTLAATRSATPAIYAEVLCWGRATPWRDHDHEKTRHGVARPQLKTGQIQPMLFCAVDRALVARIGVAHDAGRR